MLARREMIRLLGGTAVGAALGHWPRSARAAEPPLLPAGLPAGVYDTAILEALPGKRPLIKLSWRPPNYETPLAYLDGAFTPNDAFFVRYHLAAIPDKVEPERWRIEIGGDAAQSPYGLSLAELKNGYAPVEVAAVCQCSGSRRGFSEPHVPGVQWGLGAVGNARWKGARLKDVLAKAGLRKEALEIVVDGADGPVLDKTPDFVKSIPVWKALDESTIIAYEMNGEPLPLLNGAPVRLVVPGWTATYWMKHLTSIRAVAQPFDGFWMKSAYRIPTGKFPLIEHFQSQVTAANEPITEMVVNSLITAPAAGHRAKHGEPIELRGVAWDGGYGIRSVEVSSDGGKSWMEASLGQDHGRFAFRPWSFRFTPAQPGTYSLMARASNAAGQTQVEKLIFNPAGYHNNIARPVAITVA